MPTSAIRLLRRTRMLLALVLLGLCCALSSRASERLLLANCRIITLVQGQEEPFDGYIVVDRAGRIAEIGRGAPPATTQADLIFDAGGKIAMPGFISAHSHLTGSVLRGLASDKWVTDWGKWLQWLRTPQNLQAGDHYYYTLHGALDMLRGGVTTVYNYTSRPLSTKDELYVEQLEGEFAAGGHFVFGYQPSVREPGRTLDQLKAETRSFLDRAKNHPQSELLLRVSLGSVSMWYAEETSALEFEWLKSFPELAGDIQLHYLEPPPAVPRTLEERTRFAWLEKYGVLGPNVTFAHFIHPTEDILKRAAAAGATMVWNPLSNGRLGSGLADIPGYLKAGLTVGMGLDGQSSSDIADPFENMRVGLYAIRFRDRDPRGLQPIDLLRLHTIHSARAIRVADKVGTLEVGKFGDILLIDPHQPDTGPIIDLYATLVLACDRMNIASVFVAGRHVMQNGRHTTHDLREVAREVHRRVAAKEGKPTS